MKKLAGLMLLLLLLFSGCICENGVSEDTAGDQSAPATPGAPLLYDEYKDFSGEWTGQWKNTTFGSTGPSTASVEVSSDGTASFTIDVDGMVFGLLNPDPKTFSGNYDEQGIKFDAKDDLFGDLTIIISKLDDVTANVEMKGLNVPAPGIESVTATGTLDSLKVHMDYVVGFTGGGSAEGVFDLIKQE